MWGVFSLEEAVTGFSSQGVEYDEFVHALRRQQLFETESEAESYIAKTLTDYAERNVEKGVWFVVLPVYYFEPRNLAG